MKAAGPSEAEFQRQVVQLAALLGYRVFHTYDSRKSTGAGFPDLVLVGRGRVLFAELKRRGGKTTPRQDDWLAALREAGGRAFLWTPDDWDEIQRELQA